jgi:MFS family permease
MPRFVQDRHPTVQTAYLIATVFLPFLFAYFLSHIYRTVNATISGNLIADFRIDAADLGLLTSIYFLSFAVMQIPVGILLDRYGPKLVHAGLLAVAAAGAFIFSYAVTLPHLILGRAMIGLGVAGTLVAGLKALVTSIPEERWAFANGIYIGLGAAGTIFATAPAEMVMGYVGWRGLFTYLGGATLLSALIIVVVVPAFKPSRPGGSHVGPGSFGTVLADRRFWRLAPLNLTTIAGSWALQGLWAAPWLTDVALLPRPVVIRHLFVMALAHCAGGVGLGLLSRSLRSVGIGPAAVLALASLILMIAEAALLVCPAGYAILPWSIIAAIGAGAALTFAILPTYYPLAMSARANSLLALFTMGGAFVIQLGLGYIINYWPRDQIGHYPTTAYSTAFITLLIIQCLALLRFVRGNEGHKLAVRKI